MIHVLYNGKLLEKPIYFPPVFPYRCSYLQDCLITNKLQAGTVQYQVLCVLYIVEETGKFLAIKSM